MTVIYYEEVYINGEKMYRCPICGRYFSTKRDCGYHTDYHRKYGFSKSNFLFESGKKGGMQQMELEPILKKESKVKEDFVFLDVSSIKDPLIQRFENKREYLLESVQQHGVITPIIVRKIGDKYRVVAGHGRLIAARRLGLKKIPARIIPINSEVDEIVLAIEENVNRRDLTIFDLYNAIKALKKRRVTNEEILQKLKISKTMLYRILWLDDFPEKIREMFLKNEIPIRGADYIHQLQELQPELLGRLPQHLSKIDPNKRAKILEQIVKDLKRKEEAKQAKLEIETDEEAEKGDSETDNIKEGFTAYDLRQILYKIIPNLRGFVLYARRFMIVDSENKVYFLADKNVSWVDVHGELESYLFREYPDLYTGPGLERPRISVDKLTLYEMNSIAVFTCIFKGISLKELNWDIFDELKRFKIFDVSGETEESKKFLKLLWNAYHAHQEQEVKLEKKFQKEQEETIEANPVTPITTHAQHYDTLIEHLNQFTQLIEYKKVPAETREEIEYHIQQILILLEGLS